MKFSEMKYSRPSLEEMKNTMKSLTEELRTAESYEAAKAVFLKEQEAVLHVETLSTLVSIRHSINTKDPYYEEEQNFWNAAFPELQEYTQGWTLAMLESPFRKEFSEEYGELMFINAEIEMKTFKPAEEFIAALQKENDLTNAYEKLLASAQIPFEGGIYTLSQLTPFKTDPDESRRLAAWKAEGPI